MRYAVLVKHFERDMSDVRIEIVDVPWTMENVGPLEVKSFVQKRLLAPPFEVIAVTDKIGERIYTPDEKSGPFDEAWKMIATHFPWNEKPSPTDTPDEKPTLGQELIKAAGEATEWHREQNETPPRELLMEFADMITYMGGVCDVNLNEPSDGDLVRVKGAYDEIYDRCYRVSLERDKLTARVAALTEALKSAVEYLEPREWTADEAHVTRYNHKDPWVQYEMRKCGELSFIEGWNAALANAPEVLMLLETVKFYADALKSATNNGLYEPSLDGHTNTPIGTRAEMALAAWAKAGGE